jgi:hypothetical protein
MDAGSRPDRLRALVVKAVSFWLHPLRGPALLVILGAAVLVLLERVPGVPTRLRPYTCYKHWRADGFLTQAAQKHDDFNAAYLALNSALALNPDLKPARFHLAHLLAERGRFAEAAQEAEKIGMNGPIFVHDLLFYSGRFDELLAFCAKQAVAPGSRHGVWLQSALMVAPLTKTETCNQVSATLSEAKNPGALLIKAILQLVDNRRSDVARSLEKRANLPGLDGSETLLGVELLIRSGNLPEAWVWLQRHRALLNDFDARCADFIVESARNPSAGINIIKSFPMPMSDARWVRLASLVTAHGDAEMATVLCQLLSDKLPHPSAALSVSAWAILLINDKNAEAQDWSKKYRQAGGIELPVLAGRKLSETDQKARSQAVRLLASLTPLPREMISALLLR